MNTDISDIVVDEDEYRQAKSPDVLRSGGLGPCIAVGAIYSPSPGKIPYRGYLSHCISGLKPLEKMLNDLARLKYKSKPELRIYITGGALEPDDSVRETRDETLKIIKEKGFEKCMEKVIWGKIGYIQELEMNLETGFCDIDSQEDDKTYLMEDS